MPRYIGQKLDFLMTLTDTKNNALAKALNFDSSHISRMRRNERSLPKRRSFTDPASLWFARRIREPWQKQAASETITPGHPWPKEETDQAAAIAWWLSGEEEMPLFLEKEKASLHSTAKMPKAGKSFYFGRAGKREAVERFLTELAERPEPVTLLLYSDEEMDWLTEDPAYMQKWMQLLTALLKKGGRIRIVHNLTRNIGEMLAAIRGWIPLYMAGDIEPWFCPRIRDGIFPQSRFIAKGISAIISSSVEGQHGESSNIFIDHLEMVRSLERDFDALLELCRPLMKTYRPDNALTFFWEMTHFEESPGDTIYWTQTPSLFTLPEKTAASLSERCSDRMFLQRTKESAGDFRSRMQAGDKVTELLCLPDPETVRNGRFPVPLCDFFGAPDLFYRPEELVDHLRGVIRMLQEEELYQVLLTNVSPQNTSVLVKEGLGALVFPSSPPSTAFIIREQSLTASLYESLRRNIVDSSREVTIRHLEEYIRRIED